MTPGRRRAAGLPGLAAALLLGASLPWVAGGGSAHASGDPASPGRAEVAGAHRPPDRGASTLPERGASTLPLPQSISQVPYNGRFTFSRVRYGSAGMRGWGRSAWAHDYPSADRNLQTILGEFTRVGTNTAGSNVFVLEDPEIFRHPVLYVSEPGFWRVSEEGAARLREYLLKGGFLIFDDFEGRQWDNMAAQVARALPDHRWEELDPGHPVFQSFFAVDDIYVPHPFVRVTPAYYAIFEENDPTRRVMVLANHNADLAEYWEWSPRGFFPVDPTNDAYRLGVNYVVYGLSH